MTRLIDADKLRAEYQAILYRGDMFCEYDIIGMVDKAPTVDTDLSKYSEKLWKEAYERGKNERPQGEWIRDNYGDTFCSHCGVECPYNEQGLYTLGHYCQHCGANMREADND